MCIDALHKASTINNNVCLFACPYEIQVRKIFERINELINDSPAIKKTVVTNTKSPFQIGFSNGSFIKGFTTGAASGGGADNIRGQRADAIYLDESDYMNDADFDSIMALQGERPGISVFLSSTPTGERKRFYQCCTDPKLGFKEFHYPSMCNPDWSPEMEDEFRAQLSQAGYTHEILAEFGEQETGVFTKEKVDAALTYYDYYYSPLSLSHQRLIASEERTPDNLIVPEDYIGIYKPNIWRTMGIDWDKYGASSSILILDYDIQLGKFKVFKRVEVPRAEYSYDAAVNLIIELNEIYNPSYIYCDAGSGEYQIERLHIYGDENPSSGLKAKVKRWQFSNKLDIMDPITKEVEKKPLKPFMVNQLQIAFERDRIVLSPYDNILSKQLIDYEVEKITEAGVPKYTSENEHFVDALGLAYLAMVLEFKDLTGVIEDVKTTSEFVISNKQIGGTGYKAQVETRVNADKRISDFYENTDFRDLPGDRQRWVKVDMDYRSPKAQMKVGKFNRSSS